MPAKTAHGPLESRHVAAPAGTSGVPDTAYVIIHGSTIDEEQSKTDTRRRTRTLTKPWQNPCEPLIESLNRTVILKHKPRAGGFEKAHLQSSPSIQKLEEPETSAQARTNPKPQISLSTQKIPSILFRPTPLDPEPKKGRKPEEPRGAGGGESPPSAARPGRSALPCTPGRPGSPTTAGRSRF